MKPGWLIRRPAPALTLILLAATSACSAPPVIPQASAVEKDPRYYEAGQFTLSIEGKDFADSEGMAVHLLVVDPVTQERTLRTTSVTGGAYKVELENFFRQDRVGYELKAFLDVDGDGACDQEADSAWTLLVSAQPYAEETGVVTVEMQGSALQDPGACEAFAAVKPEGDEDEEE